MPSAAVPCPSSVSPRNTTVSFAPALMVTALPEVTWIVAPRSARITGPNPARRGAPAGVDWSHAPARRFASAAAIALPAHLSAGSRRPRRALRRAVLRGDRHHPDLLPADLPVAAGDSRSPALLRLRRRGRARRLPPLPALPAGACPGADAGRCGVAPGVQGGAPDLRRGAERPQRHGAGCRARGE